MGSDINNIIILGKPDIFCSIFLEQCFTPKKYIIFYRNTFLNCKIEFVSVLVTSLKKYTFFKTFFHFSILDIFKNVHFSKPPGLFKIFEFFIFDSVNFRARWVSIF